MTENTETTAPVIYGPAAMHAELTAAEYRAAEAKREATATRRHALATVKAARAGELDKAVRSAAACLEACLRCEAAALKAKRSAEESTAAAQRSALRNPASAQTADALTVSALKAAKTAGAAFYESRAQYAAAARARDTAQELAGA